MKHSSQLIALFALVAAALLPERAGAQFTFISDSATNSVYSGTGGWTAGDNGGIGMNAWSFSGLTTSSSNFVGNPANDGMGTTGIGTTAFGLFANTTSSGYVNATRSFSNSLGVGDTFSFYWAMNFDSGNSSGGKGFDIRSGGSTVFNVNNGDNAGISIGGTTPTIFNSSSYGTTPMLVTISVTTNGFTFTMSTRTNSSVAYTTNVVTSSNITGFSLYAGNQQGGGERNPYYDDFLSTNSGVFSTGGTVTNANTFSGSGALSIGNSTTLVLSGGGNNNYTGTTTISNGSTMVFAGGGASSFASTISGGGNLVVSNGAGSLVLTNNNSGLTGSVRLLGGTLSITNNNSLGGGVLELGGLASQATLSVGAGITRSQNILIQNNSTNSVISVAAASAFTSTGSLTQDGAPTSTTKFGKAGSGTLILAGASGNTYNGQIQIGEGTVIAGTSTALGTNSSTVNRGVDLGLNITDASQGNNVALLASNGVTISHSFYVSPNTNSALRTIGLAGTGSATFNNEFYMDGTLTVDAGSSPTDLVTMSGNILHVGAISKTNAGILVLSGSGNTFSGGVTLGQGTLRAGANSALGAGLFTINGGTFASDGSAARTITNNVTMGGNATLGDATGTGALTLSNINLNGTTRTLTVANNSTVVGAISNGSAAPGLTKDGAGTLTLAGTNTYTGMTTINAGVLAVTNGSAIDNGGAVSLADAANAVLAVNGSETIGSLRGGGATGGNVSIASGQTLTVAETGSQTFAGRITNAGTFVKSGAGTTTLTGANSYSGGTLVSGGRLVGDTRSLQGNITNNAALTFDQSTNGTYAGVVSGAGSLVKTNSGAVTLSGANSYNGGTLVAGGTLIGDTRSLHGNITNNATLVFDQSTNGTYAGVVSGAGSLVKTNSGAVTLSGANSYNGGTLVAGGRLVGDTRSLQGGITNNAAVTFDQTTNGTYAGALSGTGSVVKSGVGSVTFSGANSYSGGTLVSAGTLIGDTRSLQGAITNNAAVILSQTTNGSYTGLMSGAAGTLTKSGSGTVTLTANNSYTGATTVSGGRLVVNGSQGNSAVTVNNGASLGGTGTVGALTVSGLLAPGNSIGMLSAGNTTFNGGGSFELEVFDWVNAAGTGWDLLAVTGNLTLSNTSGSPFTINLVSLQDSSTPGLSTDWNQNVNFTNTFITYSGSLLGTSFASNLFAVNTNGFQNALNGTFSITNVTGGLALLYTTSFAPSSTYTWNAGSGLWGTSGNWTNGTAPTNGASIIFSGAGGASTNSSTVSSIQGLVFSNTAGAYTVSGSALAVGAGGISNASTAAQTISNNLSLSAPASITAAAGNVTLAGNLTNGGNAVTVDGAASTTMAGVVSGAGGLIKQGAGSLLLAGANAYTGTTTISGGSVVASDNSSLGATNGGTTVASGATLQLSGGISTAENITITGSGVDNSGAIRSLGDGENTLTGTITLGGNARINADSPIGSAIPLVSLGSSGFTVIEGDFTSAAYSQGASSLSLINATGGQTLFGSLVSIANWVAYQYFGLDMSVTGINPNISFAIEFMDSEFATLAVYNGTTAGITSSGGVSLLDLVSGGEDLSSVGALYFTWAGSETNFVATISNIVSVPVSNFEITGAVQGGNNVLTFGAAGPTAQGIGGNLTVSGIISGAGNTATNAATTTSLIKDGAGILTLSGANTYTGDTRIEAGTLTVSSGGTLGNGSDIFLSGSSVLRLLNNVTVGSFQGTTNTTVFINSGQRLTMNGANKGAVVQAGRITGDGGLTLAGSGNTVLQLTGDNDFRGSTVVNGGVLELAATGAGAGALRLSDSVTVGSGAILLISDSEQILDTASITLSGGTIRRGPGVNETMGGLTLTGPSTLDFGATSGQGTLAFAGSYVGNGHKLTISNFDFGSTLSFRSNLTSSISNTSLFEFVNGGFSSTSWNGTTFTITAIPEPSTYAVALGLIALMLWSARRRGKVRP